ncbi:hypothetical protein [Saccharibacillus brassicae]|uniref:Transcriptional initiation protein Tat n=1 Tax=Saccharibacillus brassicae TaxID=2583377 RepID=A0A4Y6V0J7_SACBS|nr:hypothetical protein [Saccharibacillus brassicae]QDH23582.1 hypothetical protein FFV09_23565 [Saccharibacillus brassicae]
MNRRRKRTLPGLAAAALAVPLWLAPLPPSFSDPAVHAASAFPPAPMDDPARKQLLYEISVFKQGAELMTPSSLHGSLSDLFAVTYKDRIVTETTAVAQNPNGTPAQLLRALRYVDFSFHDFFEKGRPSTSYILDKMSAYFIMHYPRSDAPGGYSDAKVQALIDKMAVLSSRLAGGEDGFNVYKTYMETLLDFYAHPNPS